MGLTYLPLRSHTPCQSLFLVLSKGEPFFSFFSFTPGISVKRNEGFLLLKGKETKLTLCISRDDSSEVDLLQQPGSLWSEGIMERAVHYFLWSRRIC